MKPIEFRHLMSRAPFQDRNLRRDLVARLNALPTVQLPPDNLEGAPTIPYQSLYRGEARQGFFEGMEWTFARIREASG